MALSDVAIFLIIALGGVQGQFPNNTVAVVGETAQLRCEYRPKSCFQIRWEKSSASGHTPATCISDDNKVSDGDKYRLDNSSFCDLVIQNVQLTDSGTFKCINAEEKSGSADLIVLQAKPMCSTSCKSDSTMENDTVDFNCELTFSGTGSVEHTTNWKNSTKSEEAGNSYGSLDLTTPVSRYFSTKAVAPVVDPYVCLTRFVFDQTPGRASNVLEVQCKTDSCNILYSVRNVETKPLLSASPGEKITCTADGNPAPSFKWQWKEEDEYSKWTDVADETSETTEAHLHNERPTKLQCVAKNSVNNTEYSKNSTAVTVSNTWTFIGYGIIVGVVVVVAVVLIITAGLVYKFCCRSRDAAVTERGRRVSFTTTPQVESYDPTPAEETTRHGITDPSPGANAHSRTSDPDMVDDSPLNQTNRRLPIVGGYN